jgi:hypothetical protein
MIDNQMLLGAQRQLDVATHRNERAAKAYELLRNEFLDAIDRDPRELVSMPGVAGEQMQLVQAVLDELVVEDDLYTLVTILNIVRAAADDEQPLAMSVLSTLAHHYARRLTDYMVEQGAFDDE